MLGVLDGIVGDEHKIMNRPFSFNILSSLSIERGYGHFRLVVPTAFIPQIPRKPFTWMLMLFHLQTITTLLFYLFIYFLL